VLFTFPKVSGLNIFSRGIGYSAPKCLAEEEEEKI
jgi:hypothetical protein